MTHQRRRRKQHAEDRGVTLIELVVSMAIMSIVLAIVTGAIISLYRGASRVEGITTTSSQVSIALNRLDSSVRYAAYIGQPKQVSGDWTVAFRSDYTGQKICTQLRVNTVSRQLQQRTWTVTSSGTASGKSAWLPLASEVEAISADGTAVNPFSAPTQATSSEHEQLRLRFGVINSGGGDRTITATDMVFTAMNSQLPQSGDPFDTNICTEVSTL